MDLDTLQKYLNSFQCSLSRDVEGLLKKKALLFDQTHNARTYLLTDNSTDAILAYFSLSFKEIDVATSVSKTTRKKLDGLNKHTEKIRSFLIGQFGKNFNIPDNPVNASIIFEEICDVLGNVQDDIGGRSIFLECEDNTKIIGLYKKLGFSFLQKENTLVQMYKVFKT